jgi:hypothetical protein
MGTGTGGAARGQNLAILCDDAVTQVRVSRCLIIRVFIRTVYSVGASVTNVFGPLVLAGIGFDKFKTSLLVSQLRRRYS